MQLHGSAHKSLQKRVMELLCNPGALGQAFFEPHIHSGRQRVIAGGRTTILPDAGDQTRKPEPPGLPVWPGRF